MAMDQPPPRPAAPSASAGHEQYMAMQGASSSPATRHEETENIYDGVDEPTMPYLWGTINRKQADAALAPFVAEDGVFLVRSRGEQFALSLTAKGKFEHHVMAVDQVSGCYTLNGSTLGRPCYSVAEVIAFLKSNDDRSLVSARLQRGLPAP